MASKKTAKKATNKFDFSDSINAITETSKTVNTQLKDIATEVTNDLISNGEQLKEMTTETYKKAYATITETVNVENITAATKSVNEYTLKTAEELVDGAIVNGEKWQTVANKAVKGGLKLAEKQQDIVFDNLETVKEQLTDCLLYTSPSPRDKRQSRMPSSA